MTGPRKLLRVIGPGLPVLLAVGGAVMGAFQLFVVRPEAVRFSRQGRTVIGHVVQPSGSRYGASARSDKSTCTIGVDDPEIGWQVVQVYGERPMGEAVPLVCLTSARKCMTAAQVSDNLVVWPPHWRVSMAVGGVLLAGIFSVLSR